MKLQVKIDGQTGDREPPVHPQRWHRLLVKLVTNPGAWLPLVDLEGR